MRTTYKSSWSSRTGSRGVCARCGRHHPKGKKQKEKAKESGWRCRSIKKSGVPVAMAETAQSTPERKAKQERVKLRNTQRKQERKAEAVSIQNKWQALSAKEQLAVLDERLGKGVGAAKQRARIQARIDAEKPAKNKKKRA